MPASCTYDLGTMVTNTNIPQSISHSAMDHDKTYNLALEIQLAQHQQMQQHQQLNGDFLSVLTSHLDDSTALVTLSEAERRRSQNMTECVAVPSSEHVAEIVGRQGCKIKALRAKTNTYIKTPVRGEEPVFVVTGRKEDVASAKREILSAADHFSQIRACRKNNLNGSLALGPPSNVPGQVTIYVTVPYRVVGLVVGPKGATIKRIQQTTQTYIVTPSRDKDPIFEVTGLPDAVEAAKREIESHIAMRTGNMVDEDQTVPSFEALGNNSDLYNAFMNNCSKTNQSLNLNPASLNALLSSNGGGYSQGLFGGATGYSTLPGYASQSHTLNGQNNLQSANTNGLGGSGSNYRLGNNFGSALNSALSSARNMLGDMPSFNVLGNSATSNNLLSNGNSNSYNNANSNIANQPAFGSSNCFGFNLLGENANNLLNSKSSSLNVSPSGYLSSLSGVSTFASGNSTLQSAYGLDEGLGSLGSSLNSSPALDQNQQFIQTIWNQDEIRPNPSFYMRPFGCASGSTSRPLSPNLALGHGSVQRSNSDPTPTLEGLSSALNEISVSGGLRGSKTSSPIGLPDYESAPYAASSVFPDSSPVRRSPVYDLLAMVPGVQTASVLDSLSSATAMSPVLAASAASAIPIGTPACSSVIGTIPSSNQSGSPLGSRRSSVDTALGLKICPSCKGESFEVAFVPCGHRRFCLPCAQKIQDSTGCCPSCSVESKEVIRIRDDHE